MNFYKILITGLVAIFTALPVLAEGLPILDKDPFFGYYMAHEERGSRYRVGRDGVMEMRLLKTRKKESRAHGMKIVFFVEEQNTKNPNKWVRKKFKEEEFKAEAEAQISPEESSFIAKASNGAEVRVTYWFKDEKVLFGMEPVSKGKAKGELRYGFEVSLRESYARLRKNKELSEKEWKKALRGDRFELKTKTDHLKLKFHEKVQEVLKKYEKEFQSGIMEVKIKSDDYMGRSVKVGLNKESGSEMTYEPRKRRGRLNQGAVFIFAHDFNTKPKGAWGFASFAK